MAIAQALPGLQVTVEVDGEPLKEHPDHHTMDEPAKVVRYVEAATEERFSIKVVVPKGFRTAGEGLSFRCVVDGEALASSVMEWSHCHEEDYVKIYDGCEITQTLLRPFRFGAIKTVNHEYQTSEEALLVERLGTVCVMAFCIKNIRYCNEPAPLWKVPKDVGIISEKALKGSTLSHNVSLEAPMEIQRSEFSCLLEWLTVDASRLPVPAAKFEFRYRSLDALKSLLIIPRTPSPPPLEERDFDSLSREELMELHKRARAAKEKEALAEKVKRERDDDNPRPRKARRQEGPATLLELDDTGAFREVQYVDPSRREVEVVELE